MVATIHSHPKFSEYDYNNFSLRDLENAKLRGVPILQHANAVSDEETAIKIAEAVFVSIYEKEV